MLSASTGIGHRQTRLEGARKARARDLFKIEHSKPSRAANEVPR
ncbi:hypothetical protein [Streptomyces vinaceus]